MLKISKKKEEISRTKNSIRRVKLAQSEEDIDDTCAHTQLLYSIALSSLWVPHLPDAVLQNAVHPLPTNLLVKVNVVAVAQSLKDEVVWSSPRWPPPHQVDLKHRVVGRIGT